MRRLIVSKNTQLAATIAAAVEQLAGTSTRWINHWVVEPAQLEDDFDVVIGVVSDRDDVESASTLLRHAQAAKSLHVILICDDLSSQEKINLLRLGAIDCVEVPLNLQRLRFLIDSLALKYAYRAAQRKDVQRKPFTAATQRKLQAQIERIARFDSNVLLLGETGVGKTFVAEQIHNKSNRAEHPFVVINCASIPEQLAESELFGHRKGAFTGADNHRVGKFAHAGKGTILLDDIDALPLSAQAKLLHAVENREFQAVGSNEVVRLEARIIAATNRDLEELIAQRQFRSDLFFRIDGYEISIPPLRDRKDELHELSDHFLGEFAKRNGCDQPQLTADATQLLSEYDWPGNIRELRNCLENGAINCGSDKIDVGDLPAKLTKRKPVSLHEPDSAVRIGEPTSSESSAFAHVSSPQVATRQGIANLGSHPIAADLHSDDWSQTKDQVATVLDALKRHKNNRSKAAEELGISRAAFYKKLQKFRLA